MEIQKGDESDQGLENLSEEIMTENFTNLVKEKTHKSRKYIKSQTRWTQTGLHQNTL